MNSYLYGLSRNRLNWVLTVSTRLILIPFIIAKSLGTNLLAQPAADSKNASWHIEWRMKAGEYKRMKRNTTSEFNFSPEQLFINGNAVAAEEMHTRGNTSLRFWRKSYAVSLQEDFRFSMDQGQVPMKNFYLISMAMDSYYYRNHLVFDCLQYLELWPILYHYTEVKINDQPEGLYLLVQRPKDYAIQDLGAKALLRRASTDQLDKISFAEDVTKPEQQTYVNAFESIAIACNELNGLELFQTLSRTIDLDKYFMWLAFNYLVSNGDYTDELFYYSLPDSQEIHFGIIPWDFDDILAKLPHEGSAQRDRILDDQLIFSSEDRLDRTIATDSFLYQKYLEQAEKMLEDLSIDKLKMILDNIQNELGLYFENPEIINLSKHDREAVSNLDGLKRKIRTTYDYLMVRHRLMQKKIAEQRVE